MFALIQNGVVVAVVTEDRGAAPGVASVDVTASPEVTVGWRYDGLVFIAPPPPKGPPLRVSKADFQRLLTPGERYGLNQLRKTIAALPPAEYADPANALLVAAEDVMFAFEQPAEFIELDHPDTAMGLALLSYLGILTETRIAQVIANQPPA